jgi:Flp pilus assembly protein TadB
MFAADRDRERAAAELREHYARGRLTLDEFSSRTARVLTARSREEIGRAFAGLPQSLLYAMPVLADAREFAVQRRSAAQAAVRRAVLIVCTAAYLFFSLALVLVLGVVLLIQGASTPLLVAFLVVWLVPTYLLSRLWHRRPPRRRATIH